MTQLSPAQVERASYIRAVLGWHDVTQGDLARVLGCTQQSASMKLAGRRRFTDDELVAIADHYGLDPAVVLKPARVAELLGARSAAQPDLTSPTSSYWWAPWSDIVQNRASLDLMMVS